MSVDIGKLDKAWLVKYYAIDGNIDNIDFGSLEKDLKSATSRTYIYSSLKINKALQVCIYSTIAHPAYGVYYLEQVTLNDLMNIITISKQRHDGTMKSRVGTKLT